MLFTSLGRSVLRKTVPSVFSTALSLRLVRYSRPRAQFFPIRTSQLVNNIYLFTKQIEKPWLFCCWREQRKRLEHEKSVGRNTWHSRVFVTNCSPKTNFNHFFTFQHTEHVQICRVRFDKENQNFCLNNGCVMRKDQINGFQIPSLSRQNTVTLFRARLFRNCDSSYTPKLLDEGTKRNP